MAKVDKKKIRQDVWMRRFMYTGIPAALIAIASLWIGRWLKVPELGYLFMGSTAIALAIGMVYNVRFVILSVRQLKEQQANEKT